MSKYQNEIPDEQLIEALRKQVAAWFSNVYLLEFEELIRRYNEAKKDKKS